MKILVLGASGMLGHKLVQHLRTEHDVCGTVRSDAKTWSSYSPLAGARLAPGVEATDLVSVARALDAVSPQLAINCIGMIKQHELGQDPCACILLNALFPHQLARLCAERSIRLIHFSTDCVFSGATGGYTEADPPDALDVYGRSKALGEVTGTGCLTLRSSIIGRELRGGGGLLEWFLRQRGRRVSGFANAIFSGFTTRSMAEVILYILRHSPDLEGLWHVSAQPISKYDLLCLVARALDLEVEITRDETLRCDRSLNSDRFRQALGYHPPSWERMVAELRHEMHMYPSVAPAHEAGDDER